MTNDHFLKDFWPPEAEMTVDSGTLPPAARGALFTYIL
jgi:hypothetical protein